MLINTFLDTEDFVHLYYPEDEPAPAQGCGAGARMAARYPRPPSPPRDYTEVLPTTSTEMTERERCRAPPPPEPPPHRVRAADLYPRMRTHYDEPGLDFGFTPICGESVQWAGRTADGGTIAMSNYRLHLQPKRRAGPGVSVPLRLIDSVESCDLLRLVLLCKHGRLLQCTFANGEQCADWVRRISAALAPLGSVAETFAAAYAAWAREQPPASVHRALMRASHAPQRHWFGPEVERLGFTTRGAWRITVANADYKLCPSYPPLLVVPATIGDEDLDSVARFRALRRIPAVVWRHGGNGAVIARSSQPEVGWFGWRSGEDERLLAAFVAACHADRGLLPPHPTKQQVKLLVVDARSYASAVTNRARGGGCECQQYYPAADIQFMSLPNIHHVRRSFHAMRAIANDPADQPNWHSSLERSLWLQYVGGVIRAGAVVARAVLAARPVLVHCSDGWDRTPQIVATAQLILDPHYRTREGFRTLIEREWLDFGHKFADRCGHQFGPEDPNERSPIFLQWLDVVYQLQHQYPCSFEFNEAYLVKLATHVHSCMFGTFLCNTTRERHEARVGDHTAHVWHLLHAPHYRNHLYWPSDQHVLSPESGVRYLRVWWGLWCGDAPPHDAPPPRAASHATPQPQPAAGAMSKTRSCDNLSACGARRAAERRRSDPSLAPDRLKLSASADAAGGAGGACRAALTDSCVDALPALHAGECTPDQVDGLHPDHFESRARDLASGSSSLERELAPPAPAPAAPAVLPHDVIGDAVANGDVTADAILPADVLDEAGVADGSLPVDSAEGTGPPAEGARPEPADDAPDALFLCDTYSDVIGMAEAARGAARSRHISITWRSVSESSNQSSGFDITDPQQTRHETAPTINSHDSSPVYLANHAATATDLANHNVAALTNHGAAHAAPTNHNREPLANGVNGCDELTAKFLEVDLSGGATSSSVSSESDGGEPVQPRRAQRTRVASQLTLCPASPRRACCHCDPHSIETSAESGISASSVWCVCGHARGAGGCGCGAGGCGCAGGAAADLDGLPPQADRLQARLHQIILHQKKVVEELSCQLRSARAALRRASPASAGAGLPRASPSAPDHKQMTSSSNGSGSGAASGSSSSGSLSEVEVGEEARGVVWLPDSAAPRCQHCRNHFWLARRRHHCRRCGGVFCGSCSEMSSWGDCAVRMCRRCRAQR